MFFSNSWFYNILFFLGLLGILDTSVLLLSGVGMNIGILFPGILGIFLLVVSNIYKYLGLDLLGIKKPIVRKILILIGGLWLLSFILIEGLIISGGHSDGNKSAEYIVVLGAALHGEDMSLSLQSRMDTALKYIEQHPNVKIIVSGGRGLGESITEAEAMKKFLVRNHINEGKIIKEEKSTNTVENLKFSKAIIRNHEKGNPNIIIVTNNFHLFRAKMLAKRLGIKAYGLPAKTPISVMFNVYFREYLAVIKSYFLDR